MSGILARATGIGTEVASLLFGNGAPVVLDSISFTGFEVPPQISVGGSQQIAVHKLPGGKRVIDAMGRDDIDLTWSGVFLSADAEARARAVDELRIAGNPVSLLFGQYSYIVVVKDFKADFMRPGHMPYSITCSVLRDETAGVSTDFLSAALQVLSDLNTALQPLSFLVAFPPSGDPTPDTVAALAAAEAGAADGLTLGSASYVDTVAALATAEASVEAGLESAGGIVAAAATDDGALIGTLADFETVVGQAGTMALLAAAGAYVGRASRNTVLGSV